MNECIADGSTPTTTMVAYARRCKQFARFEYSKSKALPGDIDLALYAVAEEHVVQLLDIFRTGCVCFADAMGPPFCMKINAFTALCKNSGLTEPWEFVPPDDNGQEAAGRRPPVGAPAPNAAAAAAATPPQLRRAMSKGLSLKEIDLIFIKVCIVWCAVCGVVCVCE